MIFPFEREAEQGAPMPDGLSLPDQLAFRFLSSMYASIRAGSITRERAISDKGKMTYQYNIANESMKQWKELGQHWSNIIKYVEFAQKYSLQGTTQSRYLTGGVPPVRFSM